MPELGAQDLIEISDLRHRVRHLQWFRQSFRESAETIGRHFQFSYKIDDRALTAAFFNWAKVFEHERKYGKRNRRDFSIFAAGLMLRELCKAEPAKKIAGGQFENLIPPDPMAKICQFWPEGYLYANYCLTLVQAILEQDFHVQTPNNPLLHDLRVWQSFRENFHENPDLATPFFDVFMGVEPNWNFPNNFISRPGAVAGELADWSGGKES